MSAEILSQDSTGSNVKTPHKRPWFTEAADLLEAQYPLVSAAP